jgi:streptogramin lyase
MKKLGRTSRSVALLSMSLLAAAATAAATAQAAPITEFTSPQLTSPNDIQPGGDGNLWFLDGGAIGRITPTGTITEFPDTGATMLTALAPGGDGNMWFSDDTPGTQGIGRITPAGTITKFTSANSGLNPGTIPEDMTTGPNGTIWFLDAGTTKAIGEITASGQIREFAYTIDPVPDLNAITEGPDGNIWFVDRGNDPGIGRVDLNDLSGTPITEYPTPMGAMPNDVSSGADGDVYFSDTGTPAIGRVNLGELSTTPITLLTHANGLQTGGMPDAVLSGPAGDVWFDDQYSGHFAVGQVTPAGQIHEIGLSSEPWDITTGIDGNLWLPAGNMMDPFSEGVLRITPTGTVTLVSTGLGPNAAFYDGTNIVSGPDGNLWTIDNMGNPVAIDRVDVQLPPTATTGAATAITTADATIAGTVNPQGNGASVVIDYGTTSALGTTVTAGTLPTSDVNSPVSATLSGLTAGTVYDYRVEAINAYGTATGATQSFTTAAAPVTPPAGVRTPTPTPTTPSVARTLGARVGNQSITVSLPAGAGSATACLAAKGDLPVTLSSTTMTGTHGLKLRVQSAAVFIDRGARRTRTVRHHGHVKRVVVYRPNAVRRRLPATVSLPLKGLSAGVHHLRVTISYTQVVARAHQAQARTVTKTLRTTITVC